MNAEKLTQKSIDAVRKAQSIAVMQSNSVIEPIHLLAGLVRQENGLIPQLLKKMNIDEDIFDSDGYLFPYSKSTEQTLDKLLESGMKHESLMVITHTVEIGHNLGVDLKKLSKPVGKKTDEMQQMIADDIYSCLTDNFEQKNTAAQFAEKYGVSDTAVKKYFKNIYGYGFKEYQTKVRMEWAADRLTTTDWSIGYISERVGYAKHTKFTTAFKKYYGVTPREYRHNNKTVKSTGGAK